MGILVFNTSPWLHAVGELMARPGCCEYLSLVGSVAHRVVDANLSRPILRKCGSLTDWSTLPSSKHEERSCASFRKEIEGAIVRDRRSMLDCGNPSCSLGCSRMLDCFYCAYVPTRSRSYTVIHFQHSAESACGTFRRPGRGDGFS